MKLLYFNNLFIVKKQVFDLQSLRQRKGHEGVVRGSTVQQIMCLNLVLKIPISREHPVGF